MDPDGRAVPRWCLKGCVQRRGHCAGIEHAVQGGDCGAGVSVSRGERHAAEGVVRPRGWRAGGIDPLQGSYELCQITRRLAWIGDALDGRGLAFEPPVDGPMPGVALVRCPLRERDRDGKRQARCSSPFTTPTS